ncbi:hypothetical protein KAR91_80155 [Candidatus Pacearchaeota archaeon]|nr:hypothetical protein [Candidatus Pacearchaeota archaeon]
MTDEQYNVITPIKLESGKTLWQKVGVAYENNNPAKKHKMMISIVALPLGMPASTELKLFIYPQEEQYRRPSKSTSSSQSDDNTNF